VLRTVWDKARERNSRSQGKGGAVPALGSAHHNFIASMAAYVGVDAIREISFVTHPVGESARLLAEEKVDALMGFPPVPRSSGRRRSAMSLSIAGSPPLAVLLLYRCGQP